MKDKLIKLIEVYNERTNGSTLQIHETSCQGGWNKLALVEHVVGRNNQGETVTSTFRDINSVLGTSVEFNDDQYLYLMQDILIDLLLEKYSIHY